MISNAVYDDFDVSCYSILISSDVSARYFSSDMLFSLNLIVLLFCLLCLLVCVYYYCFGRTGGIDA